MSYTAVGITSFVLGSETDGNREVINLANGELYDLDPLDNATTTAAVGYTLDATEFPVI